ncbi:MAG: hypothetical protein ABFD20_10195, partial [Anaerolineales bacterium]
GFAGDLDDVAAIINATFAQVGRVGSLSRLEAGNLSAGLQVHAIVQGKELLSVECTLVADDAAALHVFELIASTLLPNWSDSASWLSEALASAEAGGLPITTQATRDAYATVVRYEDTANTVGLLISRLYCDYAVARGEIQPFDPTLGLGVSRQTLQWAFEGLPGPIRLSFTRANDRMAQPVVVGTSANRRATLTLIGPDDQLVYIYLSLAVPVGVADAAPQAVTLAQQLVSTVLPNWSDGVTWAQTAIDASLAGQTLEQRRQGLRVLARPDSSSDRLVNISIAAIQHEPIILPEPEPTAAMTTVTVTGLPAEAVTCLTAVFYQGEVEVGRLPLPAEGTVSGPIADEVLLEGDVTGTCPWSAYWTISSRLPVADGQVTFAFAPVPQ